MNDKKVDAVLVEIASDWLEANGHFAPSAVAALAGVLNAVAKAEREECAKAVQAVLAPGTPAPCDCITQTPGGIWRHRCNCDNRGDLESATNWCNDQNAAACAVAAIRMRESADG